LNKCCSEGAGFASEALHRAIAITLLTDQCGLSLFRNEGGIYGECRASTFRTIGLTAAMVAIALGYRFSLFLISLHGPWALHRSSNVRRRI